MERLATATAAEEGDDIAEADKEGMYDGKSKADLRDTTVG